MARGVFFLAAYLGTAVFVLRHLTENGVVAVFWPPAGIALVAVITLGRRVLPLVFIGAFLANFFSGVAPQFALVFAAINTLEAFLGHWLLTGRARVDTLLNAARDYFRLFFYSGLIAPIVAAFLGALTLEIVSLTRQGFLRNLQYWWMGDSLGIIVVTPLLLIWRHRPASAYTLRRWVEALLGGAFALYVGQVVLAGTDLGILPQHARGFIMFIAVTWAAVRLGRHATSLLIAMCIAQIMIGVLNKRGYFAASDQSTLFLNIWLYMASLAVTGMALAIYVHQSNQSVTAMERARERLECISAIAHIGGWELDVRTKKMHFSREALRIIDAPAGTELSVEEAIALIDPDEREPHAARVQLAIEHGIGWDTEFGMVTRTGRKIWVRSQGEAVREAGKTVLLVGTAHDLTERRQTDLALRRSEIEFKRLIETAGEGVWTIDSTGNTTFVNARMAEIVGYTPDEMLGADFLSFVPEEFRAEALEKLKRRNAGVREVNESVLQHKNGTRIWIQASTNPIRDEDGLITGALAMVTDITERKRVEEELRQSETRYRQLVESSADAIIVHQSGFIVYANEPAVRLIRAASVRDVVGRNALEFVAPEFRGLVLERMKVVSHPGGSAPLVEEKFLCLDGTTVDVEVSGTGTIFNGKPATMVVARDITERKRAEAQIRYLGQHDILTGLPNRALFADRLSQTIALAELHGTAFALLFLDLDHFKKINDSYGHHYGDAFLRQVAERLRRCVKAIDTVSRQGGDEFIILLNELAHPEDAAAAARNICEQLDQPFEVDGVRLNVSVSVGIAVYPRDGKAAELLLRNADLAMYHAKSKGRNQFQFFSEELNIATHRKLETESALREALVRNEFRVYYQPQLNLQTGYVEACEALIRWQHPQRGLVAPGEFIMIAEESGQIRAIGEWVLRQVVSDLREFDRLGFRDLRIAVNVSALQLLHPDFTGIIEALMREQAVAPGRLELEVTESMLMEDTALASRSIQQLSGQGVLFAVDDFGTGYSSLSYLRRLKIHHLKIDRSFIADLMHDADDAAIVRAVINLAKNLRLRTVAEGVETAEQREFLRMHGCDLAQGFLIAKPLPLDETLTLLRANRR